MEIAAPVLEGRHVRLEPIEERHRAGLVAAASDPAIWPWMPLDGSREGERMVDEAINARGDGSMIPYTVIRLADRAIVGSTRYLNIAPVDRRLEIGWTWYRSEVQGGPVNPECKYLLLRQAFEDLGAYRVELRCDARNVRSQAAIAKLGARREGVLRRHKRAQHDFWRDTVVFAILDAEWPGVKQKLEERLGGFAGPAAS